MKREKNKNIKMNENAESLKLRRAKKYRILFKDNFRCSNDILIKYYPIKKFLTKNSIDFSI